MNTIIECNYDIHGHRATKKVTTNGSVTLHLRYLYRGYLQIACCDLSRSGHPCLWLLTWDPTQTIATRPLAIRKDGTWYAYGWDLTKNICEVFGAAGYIRTAYTYSPYGSVTATGDVTQPIQWSSEFNDAEAGLVYYHFRYYNPIDGRWISRESWFNQDELNRFAFIHNNGIQYVDRLGLRRVSGSYTDHEITIAYDFDVAMENKKGNCLLRLTALIRFSYEGTGTQQGIDQLFQQVEDLFRRNLSSIKIEMKKPSKPGCCCSSLGILFVVARDNGDWLKQKPPFIQPTSKPSKVTFDPSHGDKSDAQNWRSNNPSTALHEILHLFGLADEYYDEENYPTKKGKYLPEDHATSAMGKNANDMKDDFIKPRHIEEILYRANVDNMELKNCEFNITR